MDQKSGPRNPFFSLNLKGKQGITQSKIENDILNFVYSWIVNVIISILLYMYLFIMMPAPD